MTHHARLSWLALNRKADALAALLDGGVLDIYDGSRPQSPDEALASPALARLRFGDPAFARAVQGVSVAEPLHADGLARRAGVATWFRCQTAAGATVLDGLVAMARLGRRQPFAPIIKRGMVVPPPPPPPPPPAPEPIALPLLVPLAVPLLAEPSLLTIPFVPAQVPPLIGPPPGGAGRIREPARWPLRHAELTLRSAPTRVVAAGTVSSARPVSRLRPVVPVEASPSPRGTITVWTSGTEVSAQGTVHAVPDAVGFRILGFEGPEAGDSATLLGAKEVTALALLGFGELGLTDRD